MEQGSQLSLHQCRYSELAHFWLFFTRIPADPLFWRLASAAFDTGSPVSGSITFLRPASVDLGIGRAVLEPGACEGRPGGVGPFPVLAVAGMTVACVDELAINEAEGEGAG